MKRKFSRITAFFLAVLTLTLFVSAEEVISPSTIVTAPETGAEIQAEQGTSFGSTWCFYCKMTTYGTFQCSGLWVGQEQVYCNTPGHDTNCQMITHYYGKYYNCDYCGKGFACAGGTLTIVNGQPDFRYPNDPEPDEEVILPIIRHAEYYVHNPAQSVTGVLCEFQQ